MKIVLDTSIIIDYLRRNDKENTRLFQLVKTGKSLYLSSITQAELYAGRSVWQKKEALRALEVILSGLSILALTEDVAKTAGKLKAEQGIDLIDAIIAATALVNKYALSTLNQKHFSTISGLRLV